MWVKLQVSVITIRRLKNVRRILGPTITSRLVSAFIMSHLDYCNPQLTGLPQSSIVQLQRVQNTAVRLTSNLRPHDKISASLCELHWLPIQHQIIYKLCLMMNTAHIRRSPHYVTKMLTVTEHLPNRNRLRLSASTRYELSTLRRKIGERTFAYSGHASWNSLPSGITSIIDTPTLAHLKRHLFRLAYDL